MIGDQIKVQGEIMEVKKELGKGKSGYSYLMVGDKHKYVLKKMHKEPCPYYDFEGSKLKSELAAYEKLKGLIKVPQLVDYNLEVEYLIKEYIDGPTAAELIADDSLPEKYIEQAFEMFKLVKDEGINIDYFPTNFVIENEELVYVDYEFNEYQKEWDLINWGIYYWANTAGMKERLETGKITKLNQNSESGIPLKESFKSQVQDWIEEYA